MTAENAENTPPADAEPKVDNAALLARIKDLEAKAAKSDELANENSSMKALIEQAKTDPNAALALANHDFDSYTAAVLKGDIKPISKEAQAQAKEISKLQATERELEALKKKTKDREEKEAIERELQIIRDEIKEEEFPLIRILKLEANVHGQYYAKAEKDKKNPALKDVAKEVQDEVLKVTKGMMLNPHARKLLLSDPEVLKAMQEYLAEEGSPASKDDARRALRALTQPTSKEDKSKAPPAKNKPKTEEERAEAIVDRLFSKAR